MGYNLTYEEQYPPSHSPSLSLPASLLPHLPPSLSLLPSLPAHVVLSLQLSSHLHVVLQYFLWVGFSLLFVLFSIGFVQVVSIHAIGKTPSP